MTRPVDNTWTCDCGKECVPSKDGGALFDFQYVCKTCVKQCNNLYKLDLIPKPIWLDDPTAIVDTSID